MICPVESCTGCHSCYNACPVKAIHMNNDILGHVYPYIDMDKCIDCNLCRKACPSVVPVATQRPKTAFAAWSLDEEERRTSSSGGAASVFSRHVLARGGVVYGAALDDDLRIAHIRVDTDDCLPKLKGSKYVQSIIGSTFRAVSIDLDEGRKVLFIGTPCQIAGLRRYLSKEYQNLCTVDLVCHGVPSQQLLFEHIARKVHGQDFDSISFREVSGFYLRISRKGTPLYLRSLYDDEYYIGFMKGLFYRSSCYSCTYAKPERVSDITIGDFWGLGKRKPFLHSTSDGCSLIMPNTTQGLSFIRNCSDELFLEERDVQEAIQGNSQLRGPSLRHGNADKFKILYQRYGFEKAAKRCIWKNWLKYRLVKGANAIREKGARR